ncbi:MAG: hypothetical protein KGI54_08325 [Pseudomonadota bacterium]|nr:hypothetical protein [Pseudomonadota bacterium]
MALINHPIPNLFNGVSQQAPTVRQEGQSSIQVNGSSSIVEGLGKRHPSNFVGVLSSSYSASDFIHFIHRDAVEKYTVRISSSGSIQVWGIDGSSRTVTTPNGTGYITTSNPQANLMAITIADYTFIVNKTVTVAMLAGSSASYTSSQTVQQFADITYTASTATYHALVAGRIYTVAGNNTNSFGQYYVTPNADASALVECVASGILNSFDPATMPYALIRNADGTFTLKQNTWASRLVGDTLSAAQPSFVGRKINYMVLYRNRFGFMAGENVIFSRASDFFNFWPKTATQVLDGDPVDVAVSNNKVSTLYSAIPFNKNLVLFSQFAQFMLSATNLLTPKTVAVDQTTEYAASTSCTPTVAGSNIYFPVPGATATSLREYYVQPYQISYDADDVTAHVPTYLPLGIFRLVSSSNGDILFAIPGANTGASADDQRSIYVYKYYWSGDTKAQSSWSKWQLPVGTKILDGYLMDTKLYLTIGNSDGLCLVYIDLQQGLVELGSMVIYLDNRVSLTGAYNSTTGLTTWSLPYDPPSNVQVVLGAGFTGKVGAFLQTATRSAYRTVTAVGDYSGSAAYIGVPYSFLYTFSPQYYKDPNKLPVVQAGLKLRNFKLLFSNTQYFRAVVTPLARQSYTYQFTGKTLGTLGATLGTVHGEAGEFSFPVQSAGDTTDITIINDSPYPCFFQSAEWEGVVSVRSQRV